MANQAYCAERLMAQLDGARLVRFNTAGLVLAWFGAHGVHVYDASGDEVDYWTCGSFAEDRASIEDVEESMARHLLDLDDETERAEQDREPCDCCGEHVPTPYRYACMPHVVFERLCGVCSNEITASVEVDGQTIPNDRHWCLTTRDAT